MDLVTITRLNYSIHGKLVEYDGNNAGISSVRMIIDMVPMTSLAGSISIQQKKARRQGLWLSL